MQVARSDRARATFLIDQPVERLVQLVEQPNDRSKVRSIAFKNAVFCNELSPTSALALMCGRLAIANCLIASKTSVVNRESVNIATARTEPRGSFGMIFRSASMSALQSSQLLKPE